MIPKILLPALNLLVLSPSLWVALAAAGGFIFGIYFERKKLYGSFTRPNHPRTPGAIPGRDSARRIANPRAHKPRPPTGRKRGRRTATGQD